ncbi:MAG: hypothetical protein EHM40_19445 [Chloroflexi bacterium]|nr:MAG: hypothetical protein EHM40_19445 [Chloroflexota bacterium]
MLHRSRAIFLFLTIVAVLFVSAAGTTNVYADDGTPPPAETEEVAPPAGEEEPVAPEPTEAAPVEEPAAPEPTEAAPTEAPVVPEPTEAAPTEAPVVPELTEAAPTEAPVATEPPVVEAAPPAETESEAETILEQVPDNTTVTVLNADGEAQSLTTQESANAIITGDPIWCPSNVVVPTPGANGCTDSKANFTELLAYLKANETNPVFQRSGTIFVEMGAYAGEESTIDFNTYEFQYLKNFNLTVKGGWDTTDNSTIDYTQLDVPIVIGTSTNPWVGSLTIDNIRIDGASDQTGLILYSQGAINIFNSQVTDSLAGADLNAGAGVSVQNSQFNDNKKSGAKITAGGAVEVVDSEFNNNASSQYDGFGLEIDNQNQVTLSGVSAQENEQFGADINSTNAVTIMASIFSGNIAYSGNCWNKTITGGYGLKVVTTSWAYLDEGVQASGNYLFGARLETGADGAYVYNSSFNGYDPADVTKTRTQKDGLQIVSADLVEIVGVHADGNLLSGANVQAVGEVVVSNSFFDGNKSYSKTCTTKYGVKSCHGEVVCTENYNGYGIQVVTDGDITLDQVSAQENNTFGARLVGRLIAISSSNFSNNGSGNVNNLTGRGLEVVSTGEVSLVSVEANNNEQFGANIETPGDVIIVGSFFNGHKVYTYSGDCGNTKTGAKGCHQSVPCVKTLVGGGYGLEVNSGGTVSLAEVEAVDNYLFGAHVVAVDVLVDEGDFNQNKEGLKIESTGDVELARVNANENQLFGATILASGSVDVSDSVFEGNKSYTYSSCKGKTYFGYGIRIETADEIELSDVVADNNYVYGAYLKGTDVTVAYSSFSNNGTGKMSDHVGQGLEIVSTGGGTVDLFSVTASNNQLFGANIQGTDDVDITSSTFNGNKSYTSTCYCKTYDGYGLRVVTTGDIDLSKVTANENYLYGAHLEGANVEVTGASDAYSFFSFNASPVQSGKTPTGRGLEVISTGNTSLQYVNASNNQLFGADIQAGGQVDIVSSIFSNNKYTYSSSCGGSKTAGYGLKVTATGPITLGSATDATAGIQASGNGAEGAILDGDSTVDVGYSTFNSNGANGLSITADGNVTLTNVTADQNKGNGVEVKGICTNNVTVNGGHFARNSKYGIKVVDATYTQVGTPVFENNGSGNVFHSDCAPADDDSGDDTDNTSGSSGNNTGGNSWYGYGHHHHHHHHHGR